jgi:hypothetical protein
MELFHNGAGADPGQNLTVSELLSMPARKIFEVWDPEMPFPAFW